MRGGEKCLEIFCQMFPESPVHTLFYEKEKISPAIQRHPIRASFLQFFPGISAHYRNYLPFFPLAVESFRLKNCELVISTSHCVAKSIRKPAGAFHLCYCFTPMRYAWEFFDEYFGDKNPFSKRLIRGLIPFLKKWDQDTSARVDRFVAISKHVQRRIWNYYQREAEVIYPPVDTDFYTPDAATAPEDFYLIVSALVPYKKVNLAVRAFGRMKKRLVVIGEGPKKKDYEKTAGPWVQFLGRQTDAVIRDHYRRARALIFPGEEDFGIVPVEAQACGRPVIAYAAGGALETVKDHKTGLFFSEQTEASLIDAVSAFERRAWDPAEARANAISFGKERFKKEMETCLEKILSGRSRAR
ncbi:MAG: glycosyltransferase [Candidatus Omnitrophica bacterium]|nr:glycosyltransferase [Candidatus Omnitrophota bacterium]